MERWENEAEKYLAYVGVHGTPFLTHISPCRPARAVSAVMSMPRATLNPGRFTVKSCPEGS